MQARSATIQDLTVVFQGLAERMSSEYLAAGGNTLEARDALLMNLKEGRGHSLLQGDEPVAIIAWDEDESCVHTSFAAREAFFSASTVRFCKRHIRHIQRLCGNLPVRSYSWSDHPDVQRWFEVIGFRKVESDNGCNIFELAPL